MPSKKPDEFTQKTYYDYKTIKNGGYNQYVKGKITLARNRDIIFWVFGIGARDPEKY